MLFVAQRAVSDTIQTHKRFKRTQCIRTRHSMRILGVIPLIKLQNNTPTNRLFCSFRKGIAPKIPMLRFFFFFFFFPNKKLYFEHLFYFMFYNFVLERWQSF